MKKQLLIQQQLIALLKAKDKKAFDYLYDPYAGCLYTIIVKVVHDRELANDLLQDSFMSIWINMATYDISKGSLFTWMLNIARNKAITHLKLQLT
jgi:RNA polymerase sigma-70 factor (ECF subfamily)